MYVGYQLEPNIDVNQCLIKVFFWKFGNSKPQKSPLLFIYLFFGFFVLRFWFQATCPPKPKKRTFWSGETFAIYTHNSKFQWELPYPIPQWPSILIRSHIHSFSQLHTSCKIMIFSQHAPKLQSTKSSNFGNLQLILTWET